MATAVETIPVRGAVELAVLERSGFVESRHIGAAVVLSPAGEVRREVGDATTPVFPRSSMKPFQALAVLASGAELTEEEHVLATASHAATARHVEVVRGILAKAGLDESALRCPADWPLDRAARDELVRAGIPASPISMNCSGKHAAMLLACVTNGWSTDDYLHPDHPLQVRIRDVVERFTGERIATTGIDGCGAPVHAMSLTALARGIHRIATSAPGSPFALYRHAAALTAAVRAHGWAIDGPGRANTVVIERLGLFAKGGAEGIMIMTAPDGTTVASKTLDGSLRASTIVALELLAEAGAISRDDVERVRPELDLQVLGGGVPVGEIRVSPTLIG
ncbi:asparaginase [Clavibacter sp. VKM Ac-2872]|uniref:asparaginase n=1 Tax=Clavibacter sp. VKM Ac-2872 TaxID=2783812 RepID=UPI00188DBC60|nr:asparaginase [Clavibacter sp. VKM Ac-2872]MBF4625318.1 asparaginase [Clavibacter sp. VKM Ac-2872]